MSRNAAFDRLRAIAAFGVAYWHIINAGLDTSVFPGSPYGVDLFFVLSGYVVTSAFLKLPEYGRLTRYYARRFFRIWPLVGIFLVLNVAANVTDVWFLAEMKFPEFWKALVAIFTLRFNYLFYKNPLGYIPVAVLWTIMVEEHFYILLPGFLHFFRHNSSRLRAALAALAAIFAVFIPAMALWHGRGLKSALDFYVAHEGFEEFFIGMALYFAHTKIAGSKKKFEPGFVWSLVTSWSLVFIMLWFPRFDFLSEGQRMPWIVLTVSALVYVCQFDNRGAVGFGGSVNKFLEYWGRRSFAVYLFHTPVILILTAIEDRYHNMLARPYFTLLIYAASVMAISDATYRWIEKPCIEFGRSVGRSREKNSLTEGKVA